MSISFTVSTYEEGFIGFRWFLRMQRATYKKTFEVLVAFEERRLCTTGRQGYAVSKLVLVA